MSQFTNMQIKRTATGLNLKLIGSVKIEMLQISGNPTGEPGVVKVKLPHDGSSTFDQNIEFGHRGKDIPDLTVVVCWDEGRESVNLEAHNLNDDEWHDLQSQTGGSQTHLPNCGPDGCTQSG